MTSYEFPVLRQCKTLTASIKYNPLRVEVFRSAKYFSLSAFSGNDMLNQNRVWELHFAFIVSTFWDGEKLFEKTDLQ